MTTFTDEELAALLEKATDLHPDTVADLIREVQALRAKVKEQQEALDEWYPPRVGEREGARD